MPIQLNLLSEALAEEDLRRRDPVKRAIFAGIVLVFASFVWFSFSWLNHMIETSNLNRTQSDIDAHKSGYDQVVANIKTTADAQNRMEALQKLSAARFLQGNLLNALQHLYVPNVQLLRSSISQNITRKDSTIGKTTVSSFIEHAVLTLDAKDFSPNPGDQVNHYKDALGQLDYFKSHADTNSGIKLSNISAAQPGPDGKPFVLFSLEFHFSDQTR
ncbi:MAG TPA: hypothetical protein VGO57_03505 [Verrucomicrobiae bacterium]|jgi:hypothetical protein